MSTKDVISEVHEAGTDKLHPALHKLILTEETQFALGIHSEEGVRDFLKQVTPTGVRKVQYRHSTKQLTAAFLNVEEMRKAATFCKDKKM